MPDKPNPADMLSRVQGTSALAVADVPESSGQAACDIGGYGDSMFNGVDDDSMSDHDDAASTSSASSAIVHPGTIDLDNRTYLFKSLSSVSGNLIYSCAAVSSCESMVVTAAVEHKVVHGPTEHTAESCLHPPPNKTSRGRSMISSAFMEEEDEESDGDNEISRMPPAVRKRSTVQSGASASTKQNKTKSTPKPAKNKSKKAKATATPAKKGKTPAAKRVQSEDMPKKKSHKKKEPSLSASVVVSAARKKMTISSNPKQPINKSKSTRRKSHHKPKPWEDTSDVDDGSKVDFESDEEMMSDSDSSEMDFDADRDPDNRASTSRLSRGSRERSVSSTGRISGASFRSSRPQSRNSTFLEPSNDTPMGSDVGEEDEEAERLQGTGTPEHWMREQAPWAELNNEFPELVLPDTSEDLLLKDHTLFRALEIYEMLRRYHAVIRLSPMLFEDFCACLRAEGEQSKMLAEMHVSLLRLCLHDDEHKDIALTVGQEIRESTNLLCFLLDSMTYAEVLRQYAEADNACPECVLAVLRNGQYPYGSVHDRLHVLQYLCDRMMQSHALLKEIKAEGHIRHDEHCRDCGNVGELLVCDGCPAAYHMECLVPKLSAVPSGKWFCYICRLHQVHGVYDCVPADERARLSLRQYSLGVDRHGRRYWFLARRIFVVDETSGTVHYYSTPAHLRVLLSLLDPVNLERPLCATLHDCAAMIVRQMHVTLQLTLQALPPCSKDYLTCINNDLVIVDEEPEQSNALLTHLDTIIQSQPQPTTNNNDKPKTDEGLNAFVKSSGKAVGKKNAAADVCVVLQGAVDPCTPPDTTLPYKLGAHPPTGYRLYVNHYSESDYAKNPKARWQERDRLKRLTPKFSFIDHGLFEWPSTRAFTADRAPGPVPDVVVGAEPTGGECMYLDRDCVSRVLVSCVRKMMHRLPVVLLHRLWNKDPQARAHFVTVLRQWSYSSEKAAHLLCLFEKCIQRCALSASWQGSMTLVRLQRLTMDDRDQKNAQDKNEKAFVKELLSADPYDANPDIVWVKYSKLGGPPKHQLWKLKDEHYRVNGYRTLGGWQWVSSVRRVRECPPAMDRARRTRNIEDLAAGFLHKRQTQQNALVKARLEQVRGQCYSPHCNTNTGMDDTDGEQQAKTYTCYSYSCRSAAAACANSGPDTPGRAKVSIRHATGRLAANPVTRGRGNISYPLPPTHSFRSASGKHSLLVLPARSLRRLAVCGGLREVDEQSGFLASAKTNAQAWPYLCARPLMYTFWRYNTQARAGSLHAVALAFRQLWVNIRWEEVFDPIPETLPGQLPICELHNDDNDQQRTVHDHRELAPYGLSFKYDVLLRERSLDAIIKDDLAKSAAKRRARRDGKDKNTRGKGVQDENNRLFDEMDDVHTRRVLMPDTQLNLWEIIAYWNVREERLAKQQLQLDSYSRQAGGGGSVPMQSLAQSQGRAQLPRMVMKGAPLRLHMRTAAGVPIIRHSLAPAGGRMPAPAYNRVVSAPEQPRMRMYNMNVMSRAVPVQRRAAQTGPGAVAVNGSYGLGMRASGPAAAVSGGPDQCRNPSNPTPVNAGQKFIQAKQALTKRTASLYQHPEGSLPPRTVPRAQSAVRHATLQTGNTKQPIMLVRVLAQREDGSLVIPSLPQTELPVWLQMPDGRVQPLKQKPAAPGTPLPKRMAPAPTQTQAQPRTPQRMQHLRTPFGSGQKAAGAMVRHSLAQNQAQASFQDDDDMEEDIDVDGTLAAADALSQLHQSAIISPSKDPMMGTASPRPLPVQTNVPLLRAGGRGSATGAQPPAKQMRPEFNTSGNVQHTLAAAAQRRQLVNEQYLGRQLHRQPARARNQHVLNYTNSLSQHNVDGVRSRADAEHLLSSQIQSARRRPLQPATFERAVLAQTHGDVGLAQRHDDRPALQAQGYGHRDIMDSRAQPMVVPKPVVKPVMEMVGAHGLDLSDHMNKVVHNVMSRLVGAVCEIEKKEQEKADRIAEKERKRAAQRAKDREYRRKRAQRQEAEKEMDGRALTMRREVWKRRLLLQQQAESLVKITFEQVKSGKAEPVTQSVRHGGGRLSSLEAAPVKVRVVDDYVQTASSKHRTPSKQTSAAKGSSGKRSITPASEKKMKKNGRLNFEPAEKPDDTKIKELLDPKARHCLCKKPYDPRKFYVACNMCARWFHGSCVNVSEHMANKIDEWLCVDCEKDAKQTQAKDQTLYCVCNKPYDDKQFYVGCDGCEGWFHPICVGTTQAKIQESDDYLCPRCQTSQGLLAGRLLTRADYPRLWRLFESILEHRTSWPFREPVDPYKYPDYYHIIKHPMDLRTIQRRLESLEYERLHQFVSDVCRIFDNARVYNDEESPIYQCALILEKRFRENLVGVKDEINADMHEDTNSQDLASTSAQPALALSTDEDELSRFMDVSQENAVVGGFSAHTQAQQSMVQEELAPLDSLIQAMMADEMIHAHTQSTGTDHSHTPSTQTTHGQGHGQGNAVVVQNQEQLPPRHSSDAHAHSALMYENTDNDQVIVVDDHFLNARDDDHIDVGM